MTFPIKEGQKLATVKSFVDDVTSEPLGNEYFQVVISRYTRDGDGPWTKDESQRVLEVGSIPEAYQNAGRLRGARGRKGGSS